MMAGPLIITPSSTTVPSPMKTCSPMNARPSQVLRKCGFQVRSEVAFDFLEGVPGEFAAVENRGVLGLVEVKQVGWFEHGGKLGERTPAGKVK